MSAGCLSQAKGTGQQGDQERRHQGPEHLALWLSLSSSPQLPQSLAEAIHSFIHALFQQIPITTQALFEGQEYTANKPGLTTQDRASVLGCSSGQGPHLGMTGEPLQENQRYQRNISCKDELDGTPPCHSTFLSSLCYTTTSHWLSVLHKLKCVPFASSTLSHFLHL